MEKYLTDILQSVFQKLFHFKEYILENFDNF